jgi:hypothetical protein
MQSCACNGDLMDAAGSRGVSNNAVRVGEYVLHLIWV